MAKPNRAAFHARQPRALILVEDAGKNTRLEAQTLAEVWRAEKYPRPRFTVRVTSYRYGPRDRMCVSYSIRAYEVRKRLDFASGRVGY